MPHSISLDAFTYPCPPFDPLSAVVRRAVCSLGSKSNASLGFRLPTADFRTLESAKLAHMISVDHYSPREKKRAAGSPAAPSDLRGNGSVAGAVQKRSGVGANFRELGPRVETGVAAHPAKVVQGEDVSRRRFHDGRARGTPFAVAAVGGLAARC